MARHETLFVGPYAEWPAHDGRFYSKDPRWHEVLDGGALEWNIGISGWGFVQREGQGLELACCMPLQPRPGCPRWPMYIEWRHGEMQPGGIECVADWTAVDREAEVAWFAAAFAAELVLAEELAGCAPSLRWGLVVWVSD